MDATVAIRTRWGIRARGHGVKKKARERKGRKRRGRVSPSCSDRGRGTNAAPVSVLVSPAPHPSVPGDSARSATPGTPHQRVVAGRVGGGCCSWRAGPVQATPRSVARLPARRARQMFFVADYDAVCAIMTTSLPSLPLSHPFTLSLFRSFFRLAYLPPCRVHALCPLIPVLSLFFFFPSSPYL